MQIQLEKIDDLNATLQVDISKDDYLGKYNSTLEEHRRKSQFKGFRKGKTPLGYIKKIYGKAVLAETVNDLLQQSVIDHLTNEKIDFLGQPLPAEDQEPIDFDTKDLRDYSFKFDLGLAPDLEVTGLDQGVPRHDVAIPDEMVDTEWANYLKRFGTLTEVDDIEQDDIIFVRAVEWEEDKLKADGWEASFAIKVADLADEALQERLLKMKKTETFNFEVNHLEKDRDAAYVRKYHLGLEDDDDRIVSDTFQAEIEKIQRSMPPEVNQELFEQIFGEGDVDSEEAAKDKIRADIKSHYDRQADAMMYKKMQEKLMSANTIDLPEGFLQRWLDTRREENDPEPTEKDREDFLLDLKWQLIKDKLAKSNDLEVSEEEIQQGAYRMVYQYVGPYAGEAQVHQLAQTVLGNREQIDRIARDVMADKIFNVLKGTFQIENQAIALDDFKEEAEKVFNKGNA